MDNQRLLLLVALSFILVIMWQTWQNDYGPKPPASTPAPENATNTPAGTDTPTPTTTASGSQLGADLPVATATAPAAAVPARTDIFKHDRSIRVVTDVFDLVIDTVGGDLRSVKLIKFPVTIDDPSVSIELLNENPEHLFIAQSGILGDNAPSHNEIYLSANSEYRLEAGKDSLEVPLSWQGANGVVVEKRYVFTRGKYRIDVNHTVNNGGDTPWQGQPYQQLQRVQPQQEGQNFIYTYTGGVIFSQSEKYEKIDFSDMESSDLSRKINGGWAAMIQHYFLGAWVPAQNADHFYYSKALPNKRFILGAVNPPLLVEPAGSTTHRARLFIGPKLQDEMAEVAEGLELTVDYGALTFISQPLFWLLRQIQSVVVNWGWSIILLTLLIKLVFYKLSEASYKSMANMRKLQPKMKQLKERYAGDKQRLNQAMMEIYKKEKINPLGGCLPILVQIPVFIALYWVLLESVELRQAPFMFWIKDLSTMDPYFVLPVSMGVTMFLQQRLNPAPPDPVQAKIMMMLPFIFTVFFLWFPSGLVLYWLVNNILSIAQQWVITRRIERAYKG